MGFESRRKKESNNNNNNNKDDDQTSEPATPEKSGECMCVREKEISLFFSFFFAVAGLKRKGGGGFSLIFLSRFFRSFPLFALFAFLCALYLFVSLSFLLFRF